MVDTKSNLHIAMYPWFAMGHLTAFLHLANKLAERGHKISLLLPAKTLPILLPRNLHPHLISFFPLSLPSVPGLPSNAGTTADIPFSLGPLLITAMDLTQPIIESLLSELKPDFVFFDFTHWLPKLASNLGVKSVWYVTASPATLGYHALNTQVLDKMADLREPPHEFPSAAIRLRTHEARELAKLSTIEFGSGVTFFERIQASIRECDAVCFRSCGEMEGKFCDYVEKCAGKKVILAGPVVPERPGTEMEEEMKKWLNGFEKGRVVYCAFGSECTLEKSQFQELLLGLELTGFPFLVALKPPKDCETIEAALPDGFIERTKERGMVHGGWVQQLLILNHQSVGCFVTHCGSGSLSEGLVSQCQLVLLPHYGDQWINARLMGSELKVGVEVEMGDEDGLFSREAVREAVMTVMASDGEVAREVRANHARWREFLLSGEVEKLYIDGLVESLYCLLR